MRYNAKNQKRNRCLHVLVVVISFAVCFCIGGCNQVGVSEATKKQLPQELTFQGVTVRYPDTWAKESYESNVFRMIKLPDYQGYIKISSYLNNETQSFEVAKDASLSCNGGILKTVAYTQEESWKKDNIQYTIYSGYEPTIMREERVLIGYNEKDGKGFILVASLSQEGQFDNNRSDIDAVLHSVVFDSDEVTQDSQDEFAKNLAR